MKKIDTKGTWIAAGLAFMALAAAPASAAKLGVGACPTAVADPTGAINGTSNNNAYIADVAGGADPCNIIITFNANGSISTALGALDPYDGTEDQLVGVVNNSTKTIFSIHLSNPGSQLFGFDGDGICAYQPFTGNAVAACNGDYLGSATDFANINAALDTGDVQWANGILPGQMGYFSLEEPASLNLNVNGPEPGTLSLLGLGLIGAGVFKRYRKA
jgi:PEP-CTERM motif